MQVRSHFGSRATWIAPTTLLSYSHNGTMAPRKAKPARTVKAKQPARTIVKKPAGHVKAKQPARIIVKVKPAATLSMTWALGPVIDDDIATARARRQPRVAAAPSAAVPAAAVPAAAVPPAAAAAVRARRWARGFLRPVS